MPLAVGTLISGYRIEAVLGSGGMGTVYRAAHPSLPRSDALKILSAELSQNPDFRARFTREADLAASLDHPNIVAVYDRGETPEGQLWIAMQYVPGSDADKEVAAHRMTPSRALHIVTEVGKALDYAHRRKLLHRDVKPANFLLSAGDERVLLADFGIARALDDASGLTATGMVMASVAYAAPESLSGEAVDGRADIYSLGCSLYRMLTGETPFATSGGMAGMAAAHLSMPPPRVTDRNPGLHPAIDAVIATAMAKEPEDRYASAAALCHAAALALGEGSTSPVHLYNAPTGVWASRPAPGAVPPAPAAPTYPGGPSGPVGPPGYPQPAWNDPGAYPSGYFSGPFTGPPGSAPPMGQVGGGAVPPRRRRWRLAALIAAAVLVIVAATVGVVVFTGGDDHPYTPQTFTHAFGTTEIRTAPRAVAALGPGDADAVLSLGVQPVVIGAPGGTLPGWEKKAVTGSPAVVGFADTSAIAAAKPDVIIATGDIDDATYQKLTAIAPTITRPTDGGTWTWTNQLRWVGRIVGQDAAAQDLVNAARSQADDLRGQHPAFQAKSVVAVSVSDNGTSVSLIESNITNFLNGLGFRYVTSLQRSGVYPEATRPVADMYDITQLKPEVLLVLRTDRKAGGGGYGGLPSGFATYGGSMVIVDDADVLAALADPGGYLATQYLDSVFVAELAKQIQ